MLAASSASPVSAPAVLRTLPSQAVRWLRGMDVVSVINSSPLLGGFSQREGRGRSIEPHGSSKMVCRSGQGPGTQPSLEIDAKARPATIARQTKKTYVLCLLVGA